jgi:hypothetical protein
MIFEKQQIQSVDPTIKSGLAINQRVNSAIGAPEKIKRDSRSKKREKRLRPFGRPSG